MRALQFTATLVTALIMGALAGAVFGAWSVPRFSEISGNDGVIVWRLDNRTGRVSVCGSALAGRALAQAENQLAANMRSARGDPAGLASLGPAIDQLDSLSRPRCSPWSLP